MLWVSTNLVQLKTKTVPKIVIIYHIYRGNLATVVQVDSWFLGCENRDIKRGCYIMPIVLKRPHSQTVLNMPFSVDYEKSWTNCPTVPKMGLSR